MAMVTKAHCDRCGAESEAPGPDLWKQIRVYPTGLVFEVCRQCGADALEFIRTAPEGSLRALLKKTEPPKEAVVWTATSNRSAEDVERAVIAGEGIDIVAEADALAEKILEQADKT